MNLLNTVETLTINSDEKLLSPGDKLSPARVGVCCTVGRSTVQVYKKIKVIVFSTGAEVVEVDQKPNFGQIFDSNRHVLISMLSDLGYCEIDDGGILPDEPQGLNI